MNLDDIPEPLIEKNTIGFLGKTFLTSLATVAVVNCTMLPHYKLVAEETHKECIDVAEALEKEGISKGWDRTQRTFNQWRRDGLFSQANENETLEARAEACQNLGPIMLASIWYGEKVVMPIEENWVITIGRRDPSTWETGRDAATGAALEAARQTRETTTDAYQSTKDWFGRQWENITGGDEEPEDTPVITTPVEPPQMEAPAQEPPAEEPRYNENGDLIEEERSIKDRALDTFDGIDWSPWN